MKTRMQPVANLCNKLPRLVRDLSAACGKEVRLELEGIDTELDRTIIDAIRDPVRISSGTRSTRHRAPRDAARPGQERRGRIVVRAWHEGGKVHIEVADDGGGLPVDRIRERWPRAWCRRSGWGGCRSATGPSSSSSPASPPPSGSPTSRGAASAWTW